jgi:hypothetical protein
MTEPTECAAVKTLKAKAHFWATIRLGLLLAGVVLVAVTILARAIL